VTSGYNLKKVSSLSKVDTVNSNVIINTDQSHKDSSRIVIKNFGK